MAPAMALSMPSASCHSCPFSHALVAVPQRMVLLALGHCHGVEQAQCELPLLCLFAREVWSVTLIAILQQMAFAFTLAPAMMLSKPNASCHSCLSDEETTTSLQLRLSDSHNWP